jgi:hypothetical protein
MAQWRDGSLGLGFDSSAEFSSRSVHDQVSRSGYRLAASDCWPNGLFHDFAELCAVEAPIVPVHSSVLR